MESKKKKILVLEDEKPLARALELKLVHEGFEVITSSNGEGVISLIEKNNFSLIICDMLMPKFDGFQVLQTLSDKKLKIPVIVLTNLSQSEDEKRVRALGASDFYIKSDTPITTVVERIKQILETT
ncbi:MAG: response regulator [Candidatus Taylorbacteria bacterium]|nr:response regulator [Candidatus Taylorbacteria bacterium]